MTTCSLNPFGLLVSADGPQAIESIGADALKEWIARERYVLLRGFDALSTEAMIELAKSLGDVLEWEFGAINELAVKPDARNYIYTTDAVPFHWDGAFVGKIPHYILFSCDVAPPPDSGGETIFCDGAKLLATATNEQKRQWQATTVTYSCEKIVHYGGSFRSPLIAPHPVSGEETLRFAEPVHDLNPVTLEIDGPAEGLIEEMAISLRNPRFCAAHVWSAGDVLIADNHALLHGRNAFVHAGQRHIRRINIL